MLWLIQAGALRTWDQAYELIAQYEMTGRDSILVHILEKGGRAFRKIWQDYP